jgi:hypothetical protein
MATVDARALAAVEAALSRVGLLLQHDRALPSVTALVAGQPIAGSWWGHPRGHDIYAVLVALEAGAGALSPKLINGKVTFVHERLWPALLGVLESRRGEERAALSPLAERILGQVEQRGRVRGAELRPLAPAAQLKQALGALESRLLVHVTSEHTPSGAHEKVLGSWAAWESARPGARPHEAPATGLERLRAAALALAGGGDTPARLPWQ